MLLICRFAGHSPEAKIISNAGHRFTRCARCCSDLVDTDGRWSTAPKGFSIVWRAASTAGSTEDRGVHTLSNEIIPATEVLAPLALAHPLEAGDEPSAQNGFEERRARVERRAAATGTLPKFLNGRDRRRFSDRRSSFGSRGSSGSPAADLGCDEHQLLLAI